LSEIEVVFNLLMLNPYFLVLAITKIMLYTILYLPFYYVDVDEDDESGGKKEEE
jgi:hypothetical protein